MPARTWTNPRTGAEETLSLAMHTPEEVAEIAARSHTVWLEFRQSTSDQRAAVLESLAAGLEAHEDELVEIADLESALGETRLRGELARTAFQLRMFAEALTQGTILEDERDEPVEGPPPAGRPELVRRYIPLGPVAVFGASNFPFAFSVLGGDTASALAAGCTVVVKEHSAQPRLGERTVAVARESLQAAGHNPDIIQSVRGTQAGADLVGAPEISAVGFTGSLSGGRTLYDIAVNRAHPIPFYGELGSMNQVVVTREAAAARPEEIGKGFVESLLLGAGQFCTKPSVLLYPRESRLLETVKALLDEAEPMALLTTKIADQYASRVEQMRQAPSVVVAAGRQTADAGAWVTPTLFEASVDEITREGSPLSEECFGPSAVVVPYDSDEDVSRILSSDEGILVGCIHAEPNDPQADDVIDALTRRAGRVVWNGWPTGVAVTRAQMHGGPYPAATVPGATSVGLHAVMRFARPVVWQSFPEDKRK